MLNSSCLLRGARGAIIASASAGLVLPPPLWAQAAPSRPQATGHSPALKSRAPVTVNFVNADIEAVTRAFGAMIERQIAVDPRVKGNITVYSDQPLSVREAYLSYLSALRGLGFTMVENGGLLKVVPEADAKLQAGTVSVGAATMRGDQVLTQIFTLRHENPNNMVPILRPLISANNTINVNPGTSSLVITDYADNLQRLAKIIAALDQPAHTDFEIVPLKHAVATDIAQLVQRLADGGSGAVTAVPGAPPPGGATTVIPDGRSNSLIVRAPNAARLAHVLATIDKLDREVKGAGATGNIWVVHLKNADATKLATVLRASFGGGGGTGGGSSSGPGGSAAGAGLGLGGTGAGTGATTGTQAGQTGAASAQSTAPIAASAQPSTGGFVQADPSTNSLIITATEPFYRQVRAMIDQLDTRRAQVYIESLIVEVKGDNAADFGFQWQGVIGKEGDSTIIPGGTNFGIVGNILGISAAAAAGNAAAATALLGEGLNIGVVRNFGGTYGLAAIAKMLQSQTSTNIVSTPNLITLDNEEAKIVVGANVPFITGQYSNTGGAGGAVNPFQTIERQDVGLTLRIRPQIGEGGSVRMKIFQESSQIDARVAPGTSNAGPSTSKRSIESNVVVDDGTILVLGGLIEDKFEETRSQVPLLGDIPYIGGLFRSSTRTKQRTNLMVFLRPVVMRDSETANRLSLDRYDIIRAQQQNAQPAHSLVLPINESPVLPPLRGGLPTSTLPIPTPIQQNQQARDAVAPAPAASAPPN
ncbi:MAG TPA: type II secretion system secretin GspD [Rubrivivax sp.]